MSSSIDERIVEMQFNNSSFEKNVNTSLNTIDKLNDSLDNLSSFDSSGIGSSIDNLSSKFDAFGVIGMTAISNITNKLVDMGLEFASSMTVDQISEGFEKYTSATKDIMALLNATDSDIETVTEQVADLSWYSDATSYSYSAMVTALKSFTAQDIDIDDAIPMIMGIGNSLSYAGLAAEESSSAFNLYSKAIGQGYMSLTQWKSLNLMGASTAKLKQQYIDAGLALGTLQQEADGTIKTLGGLEVTVANFDTTLSDTKGKWLTTDVMKAVLGGDYGTYTTNLKTFSDAFEEMAGSSADVNKEMDIYSGFLEDLTKNYEALDNYDDAGKYIGTTWTLTEEGAKNASISVARFKKEYEDAMGVVLTDEEAKTMYDDLMLQAQGMNDSVSAADELGRKYLDAAQKARTFGEAVNAVKDAASSAWSAIFQNVLGNAEEATQLWTDFSSWLYDAFMGPTELLADITEAWNLLGGRDNLFGNEEKGIVGGLQKLGPAINSIIAPIKEAFSSIFGTFSVADLAEKLKKFTDGISDFADKLTLTEDEAAKVKKIFEGVFGVFDIVRIVVKKLVDALKPLGGSLFKKIGEFAMNAALNLADFILSVRDYLETHTGFETAVQSIANIFSSIGTVLDHVHELFSKFVTKVKEFASQVKEAFKTGFGQAQESGEGSSFGFLDALGTAGGITIIVKLIDLFKKMGSLGGIIDKVKEGISGLTDAIKGYAVEKKTEAMQKFAIALGILAVALLVLSRIDSDKLTSSLAALATIAGVLIAALAIMEKVFASSSSGKGIGGAIKNLFSSLTKGIKVAEIIAIAGGILILAVACKVLAGIEATSLAKAVLAIAALLTEMALFVKFTQDFKTKGYAGLILLATALTILAVACKIFASIPWEGLGKAGAAITVLLAEIAGFTAIMNKMDSGKMLAIYTSVLIFSAAITVMSVAMGILALIPFTGILKAAAAIAIVVGIFTAMAAITNKMDCGKIVAVSAALLIFGIAIDTMAIGMAALALIPWQQLAIGVGVIVALMAALVIAGTVGAAAVPGMLGVAGALALLGIAVAAFAAGMALLAVSATAGMTAFVASIGIMLTAIPTLTTLIANAISAMIQAVFTGMANSVTSVLDSIAIILTAVFSFVVEKLPMVIELAFTAIMMFIEGLTQALPNLIAALVEMIIVTIESIAVSIENNKERLETAISNLLITLIDLIFGLLGKIVTDVFPAAVEIIGNFIAGMVSMLPDLIDKVKEIGTKIVEKIKETKDKFKEAAKDAIQGFINGIKEKITNAVDSVKELGSNIITGLKDKLGIHSPSTVFASIGENCNLGLAQGLTDYSDVSVDAASETGSNIATALNDQLANIGDTEALSGLDLTSTVSPVLDLSSVDDASATLSDLSTSVNTAGTVQVEATSSSMDELSTQIKSLREDISKWKENDTSLTSQLPDKLADCLKQWGVYMDKTKVGRLVSQYQTNVAKANG